MPGGLDIRWLVDAAIAITVLEMAILWLRGASARRSRWRAQQLNVLAGLFLMLALRAALAGAGGLYIVACLAAAGLAHAIDLRARLRSPGG